MNIEIRLFGILTDLAGGQTLSLEPAADTDTLLKNIQQQYPVLQQSVFVMAVNNTIVQENQTLSPSDNIALLPPYSGG